MPNPKTQPYLSFTVDDELLKQLDDYRFSNRFTSRADAIRFLLEWALKENPKPGGNE